MKFSIFIPVYNGEKHLKDTLESIYKQSFSDFNVFLVDDGSRDNSLEIISEYCNKDSRFMLFRKKNEGSVPFSWRYILPKLDGDYIQYMSQDDILEEDYFLKMYKSAEKFSYPDAIVSSVEFYKNEVNNRIDQGWNNSFDVNITGSVAYEAALNYSIPGFCCWKRELIQSISFVTEAFNSDELMQRIWFKACNKVVFSDALFRYRQNNNNAITKSFSFIHYSSLKTNISLLKSMYDNDINIDKINKLAGRYYQGLFVLMRQYSRFKNNYTLSQQKELQELFVVSYDIFHKYAKYSDKGIRNIIYRLTAYNYTLLKFATKIMR